MSVDGNSFTAISVRSGMTLVQPKTMMDLRNLLKARPTAIVLWNDRPDAIKQENFQDALSQAELLQLYVPVSRIFSLADNFVNKVDSLRQPVTYNSPLERNKKYVTFNFTPQL